MSLGASVRWPAIRILAAVAIWGLHFGLAYGTVGLACPRGLEAVVPWIVGAVTAVAVVAVLALAVPVLRGTRPARAADWVSGVACVLAITAMLWQASALLWSRLCP